MTNSNPDPAKAPRNVKVSRSGEAAADCGGIANTGVMGDVHIEHHHHHARAQADATPTRATWMPLETGFFPYPNDNATARQNFAHSLLLSMIESFGDRPMRFTVVLSGSAKPSPSQSFIFYELLCHHREFVARAARLHHDLMLTTINARLTASDLDAARQELMQQIAERYEATAPWRIEGSLHVLPVPVPYTLTYEPALRRLQLQAGPPRGTTPDAHDDKVSTTSEALAFACELGGHALALIADPVPHSHNQPLMKLITYILEHRAWDFSRFRVMQNDPETWDFRFP